MLNFTESQGKMRFEIFPSTFMKSEKVFEVHVTREFFLNSWVKWDQDQLLLL